MRVKDMTPISFTILGLPVAKGRPKFFRRGSFVGTYTPKKTEQYGDYVLSQAFQYRPKQPLVCPLCVVLRFFFPIPASMSKKMRAAAEGETCFMDKKPDVDNLIKGVLDPLNNIFWTDDKLVVDVRAEKRYSLRPRVEVTISEAVCVMI